MNETEVKAKRLPIDGGGGGVQGCEPAGGNNLAQKGIGF